MFLLLRLLFNLAGRPLRWGTVMLFGLAIEKELKKPRAQRTWHGAIGPVPYDFRPPTLERLKSEWWRPGEPVLLTPHAFGVGWGINLARVAELLRIIPPPAPPAGPATPR